MLEMESGLCLLSEPEPSGLAGATEDSTPLSKRKHPFGDLGKPTLRGIRKCPKCGTFNGTRGISCKNKSCDVVFKEIESKRGSNVDSVKIVTGSTSQLYSVRLRERGPDYRGFVQLPFIQNMDGKQAIVLHSSVVSAASVCYVESCNTNSSSDSSLALKSGENSCAHIRAAIACSQQATPIAFKNNVLDNLPVTNEIRLAIWLLAKENSGPIVQRVTKNTMAVKCKVTPKQPLGFLHCAFFETNRHRKQPDHKYMCSCKAFKLKAKKISYKDDFVKRACVHLYACICAFASDEKLAEEFAYFVNFDHGGLMASIPSSLSPDQQILSVYEQVEDDGLAVSSDTNTFEVIISQDELLTSSPEKKRKKDDTLAQASSALLTLQEQKQPSPSTILSNVPQVKQTLVSHPFQQQYCQQKPQQLSVPPPQQTKTQSQKKPSTGNQITTVDESTAQVSFCQWLESVTERINQTMHYGFPGTPDPLVFHAPQIFFDCLQQRISAGLRKKRLPNFTTDFVRKEALPLGTFTKYTWNITNLAQVKQIFDTPQANLELTRCFIENRDGTFDPYEAPRSDSLDSTKGKTPIRPFELKTFLKAGVSGDQKDVTPFIIEWIPDILPLCHIGELRIKFEYGHLRNGHVENRNPVPVSSPEYTMQLREILPS